jgi:beta-glucosidase
MSVPDDRLAALSLERKVRLLTGADAWGLHAEPAAGLRRLVVSDGPAGVRGERWDERDHAANVPSPTALAATWDEARIERLGDLLAAECRRKGVDVLLAPTVNLHRTPYGGRHFECFSEDPLLTARIGAAYVRGLQGAGVGATVKHFVANDSETERFTLDARVDERPLRELYLWPFEAIVRDARPWAVMAAYNGVNGHTMTESPLLADVLKGEWGFDGVVMSDWFAARDTERAGRAGLDLAMPGPGGPWGDALVAAVRDGRVPEEAVDEKVRRLLGLAARVGALDGVAPGGGRPAPWAPGEVAAELRATAAAGFVLARNDGLLPLAHDVRRIAVIGPNAAVARTMGGGSATVFPPYTVSPLEGIREVLDADVVHAPGPATQERLPVARPQAAQVAFLAADGTVLETEERHGGAFAWMATYNDLPAERVAAVEVRARLRAEGAGEHVLGCSGVGRFRLAVDGEEVFDGDLGLAPGADIAEAHMRPPQHGVPVTLEAGETVEVVLWHATAGETTAFQLNLAPPRGDEDEELDRAAAVAAEADVAVVVVGTTEEVESEGFDREDLALPGRQDELVRRVVAANPRTVVVVNSGAPVLMPWAGEVPALLLTWFGGQEHGRALADVLAGAVEPGGRLPTTWPASAAGLPSAQPQDGVLAYTEGLAVGYRATDRDVLLPFGHGLGYTEWNYLGLTVEGDTARVRLRNAGDRPGREVVQLYASPPGGDARLVGFAAVEAGPGEELDVDVAIDRRRLARWDAGWVTDPGPVPLAAGRSVADLRLEAQA